MAIALLTPFLTPYRMPLFERLAARDGVEVLCFGGGSRYVPAWFADLDAQLERAPFPARRLRGARDAFAAGRSYDAVIAGFAGGALLPAAYLGARRAGRPFVLWASVWRQPRSLAHTLAAPLTRRIYRDADAVLAYGEHVRRFVAARRGRDDDVFVAPQAVDAEAFGRHVGDAEIAAFRAEHALGAAPLVLYAGRLVSAKGIEVLLEAWRAVGNAAPANPTLVLIGDGPLAPLARQTPNVRLFGTLEHRKLVNAYAAAELVVLPSVPTRRFTEPWGLVCNEAMHQARPVIASDAVGAVAGALVVDELTGLVVPAGNARALRDAIVRLLRDEVLRKALGQRARDAVAAYNYDAAVTAFERALSAARAARSGGRGARPARRS